MLFTISEFANKVAPSRILNKTHQIIFPQSYQYVKIVMWIAPCHVAAMNGIIHPSLQGTRDMA